LDPVRKGRTRSLTAGIVRITIVITVLMVVAAFGVTFFGTYRAATSNARSRQVDYLRLVTSDMNTRFATTSSTVRRAARVASRMNVGDVGGRFLASQYVIASEQVGRFLLLNEAGGVVASYPGWTGPVPDAVLQAAARLDVGEGTFGWDRSAAGETPVIWAIQHFELKDGSSRVLAARVRTGFMKSLVTQVSSNDAKRSAAVTQNRSVLVTSSAGPVLNAPSSEYGHASPALPGALRVDSLADGPMRGFWAPIRALTDLGWRVILAEAESETFDAAMRSTVPTAIVLAFGGLLGVFMAWLVSIRLVRPIRQLTGASLKAASGAYVAPLETDREDEVGRLAEAFNEVAVRLNALHDVSLLLSGAARTDQVLDAIVEATSHLAGPGPTAVYLADDSGRLTLARSTVGLDAPHGPLILKRTGRFHTAWKDAVVTRLAASELPGRWAVDERQTRVLAAPLTAGSERVGVIVVIRHGLLEFSDAEVEMLTVFAPQAAIAVSKSELFAREIESRRAAEVLRDVAAELVRPGTMGDALPAVRNRIIRGLSAREVIFAFEDRRTLGLPDSQDPALEALVLAGAAAAVRPGFVSTVVERSEHPETDSLLDRFEAGSLLLGRVAPESAYGAVILVAGEARQFSDGQIRLLDGIAKTMTIALDNAYSSQRSLSRAANLEKVFRISQAVGSSLRIKVVLNRVLDVVQMIFSADAVSLMTYEPERQLLTTSMARGSVSSKILHLTVAPDEDVPGQVFLGRQPVLFTDVSANSLPLAVAASEIGLHSLMAVPLLARGDSIGVLNVFARDAAAFDDEDMELLQTFASQAALAIDTARMYEREHDVADVLQRSVLPEKPAAFAEIETATVYEPAGSDVEIGGDYYDLFRAPDGSVVIAVADVCGKGVLAATKTSMIKYSVRALVAAGLGPADCLVEINKMVVAGEDTSDILTVWIGFLDTTRGLLRWANGGHPPGLLLRGDGRDIERLATTGPLLGASGGAKFEESRIAVRGGDTILLYTDGVTEARSGNKFFGEGRVRRALRYGGTPDSVSKNLLAAVRRFTAGEPRDDMAIVAVRIRSASGTETDAGHADGRTRERE